MPGVPRLGARSRAPFTVLAGFAVVLAACGSGVPESQPATLDAEIVASELTTTDSRFPVGIVDHNTPVRDATVRVRFFLVGRGGQEPKGESDAPFKGDGLQGAGVYVAQGKFDVAGNWGAEITAQRPTGSHAVLHKSFSVLAKPLVPAVGQPAPRSRNQTIKDVPDASYIDSGQPPNDMHQISIADAIAQNSPTLAVFASPAFCTSRICGPEVKVVESLESSYRNRLTFIHVEIYTDFKPDPSKKQLARTVIEWNLQTEPWVFLIDKDGTIRARFEGPTASDELKAAIDRLLAP